MISVVVLVLSVLPFAWTQASHVPDERRHADCTVKSIRKPWTDLTTVEKQTYIDADLCLMALPAKSGIKGAVSRWDELQYVHAAQGRYIHHVGAFLPFHRYFVTLHEQLLRADCNYTGPLPYWDEPLDVGNISASALFSGEPSFGGNGTGSKHCIDNGPFANLTLHIKEDLTNTDYCITRSFNDAALSLGSRTNAETCLKHEKFVDAWICLEGSPHSAGHGGVMGTMVNVLLSPGDPVFYLHHGYLDRLWWEWQSRDLSTRLTEIGGNNTIELFVPPGGFNFTGPPFGVGGGGGVPPFNPILPPPDKAFEDYFNDGGNVTTLNHTLWSAGIMENITIADVMNPLEGFVCADYLL